MTATASQAYLNARVSIMSARLFTPAVIASLAQQSLNELATSFGLAALLDEQLPSRAKSRAVEQAFIRTLLSELTILVRPMAAKERALVLSWGRKYALFNLKSFIRSKLYDLDQSEVGEDLYELPPNVQLPQQALFGAEDVLELLRQLEQGPYSLIARQAREVYEQKREPFALEATIDQRYYMELAHRAVQFDGESLRALQDLVGAILDQINLMWLLRFRFSYQLSPSETFYRLLPSFRLLNRDRLLTLVNLNNAEQVMEALPPPLDTLVAGSTTLIEIQRRMGHHMAGQALRILHVSRCGVARALAYLVLREIDFSTLFALIQGRLLNLPRDLVEIAVELTGKAALSPAWPPRPEPLRDAGLDRRC
jgi:V/A-type H+-transporting ATPase subunit C